MGNITLCFIAVTPLVYLTLLGLIDDPAADNRHHRFYILDVFLRNREDIPGKHGHVGELARLEGAFQRSFAHGLRRPDRPHAERLRHSQHFFRHEDPLVGFARNRGVDVQERVDIVQIDAGDVGAARRP